MVSDKILPCADRVDDRGVADLNCRGCNPVAAVAIVVDQGRAATDAMAELTGDGKGEGGTTTGGGRGHLMTDHRHCRRRR